MDGEHVTVIAQRSQMPRNATLHYSVKRQEEKSCNFPLSNIPLFARPFEHSFCANWDRTKKYGQSQSESVHEITSVFVLVVKALQHVRPNPRPNPSPNASKCVVDETSWRINHDE